MNKNLPIAARIIVISSAALLSACAQPPAPAPAPPPPPVAVIPAPAPVQSMAMPSDPDQTIIENGVTIGADTRIGYDAVIGRHVTIGKHNVIGSHSRISNAVLGDRVSIAPGVKIGN